MKHVRILILLIVLLAEVLLMGFSAIGYFNFKSISSEVQAGFVVVSFSLVLVLIRSQKTLTFNELDYQKNKYKMFVFSFTYIVIAPFLIYISVLLAFNFFFLTFRHIFHINPPYTSILKLIVFLFNPSGSESKLLLIPVLITGYLYYRGFMKSEKERIFFRKMLMNLIMMSDFRIYTCVFPTRYFSGTVCESNKKYINWYLRNVFYQTLKHVRVSGPIYMNSDFHLLKRIHDKFRDYSSCEKKQNPDTFDKEQLDVIENSMKVFYLLAFLQDKVYRILTGGTSKSENADIVIHSFYDSCISNFLDYKGIDNNFRLLSHEFGSSIISPLCRKDPGSEFTGVREMLSSVEMGPGIGNYHPVALAIIIYYWFVNCEEQGIKEIKEIFTSIYPRIEWRYKVPDEYFLKKEYELLTDTIYKHIPMAGKDHNIVASYSELIQQIYKPAIGTD